MKILLILFAFMILGLLSTRLMKVLHLPNVTGYLLSGLIIGPAMLIILNKVTNWISVEDLNKYKEMVSGLSIITDVALGFIALSIGVEFKIESMKHMGKKIVVITIFQCLLAVILVDIALIIFAKVTGMNMAIAIMLGAIASATAPAATLLVVRQYNAKGPLVNTLLPVVALDDAVGLMVFSISFAISKTIAFGDAVSITSVLVNPILEIILSLLFGFVCGVVMTLISKLFKSRDNNSILMVAFTFLCVALSQIDFKIGENIEFSLSSLLVCMMLGATYTNLKKDSERFLHRIDEITPPIFLLFFVISGAGMDLSIIPTVGVIGVIYIIVRSLGKYLGAAIGCKITKAEPSVTRYLGITLLPQAGVAIGMANVAKEALGDLGIKIYTIVLFSTFVYEIVGPLLTKWALTRAGEINRPSEEHIHF